MPQQQNAPRWRVLLAFAAIYLIWGSSYLGVSFAIDTIPPFIMTAMRFTTAGLVLIIWAFAHGAPRPTASNWRAAAVTGALLFLVAAGGVVWGQQYISSGVAALIGGLIPLWMVLMDWLGLRSTRPGLPVFLGLALGFAGVVLLISPGQLAGGAAIDIRGAAALLISTLGWSSGSIVSRKVDLPASPSLTTGMQLFSGGSMLILAALLTGETANFDITRVSAQSWLALLYITSAASVVAFSGYVWLLRVSTPARVATYAYVNPVIAVVLGALLKNEPFTGRTLLAAVVILSGVVIINTYRGRSGIALNIDFFQRMRRMKLKEIG